ncbi:MAG: hypothetical protein BYD32DRAFT_436617 [Podila humilis]|nr:MAG: hypothetical protein BYD32DRAFT_436617 [Podila humilis]
MLTVFRSQQSVHHTPAKLDQTVLPLTCTRYYTLMHPPKAAMHPSNISLRRGPPSEYRDRTLTVFRSQQNVHHTPAKLDQTVLPLTCTRYYTLMRPPKAAMHLSNISLRRGPPSEYRDRPLTVFRSQQSVHHTPAKLDQTVLPLTCTRYYTIPWR